MRLHLCNCIGYHNDCQYMHRNGQLLLLCMPFQSSDFCMSPFMDNERGEGIDDQAYCADGGMLAAYCNVRL
ncbi:hypothetical protein D1872_234080 [compost metagenome]